MVKKDHGVLTPEKIEAALAAHPKKAYALMVSLLKQAHAAIDAEHALTKVEMDEIFALIERLIRGAPDEKNLAMANCGLAILHNEQGNIFCEAEEWAKAASEFDEAIRLDSSDASYFFNRGFAYFVSGESEKAVADYMKAAEMGNEDAMITLGHLYRFGTGVTQDKAKGVQWYLKTAEQGNACGQRNMGECYMEGDGVPEDEAEGAQWYLKSAEQGDVESQHKLGYLYENSVGLPVDCEKAFEWYRKAAAQGYITSQFALGRFYRDGLGVAVDIDHARSWFEKAAAQGNKSAQSVLRRWQARERGPWLPF